MDTLFRPALFKEHDIACERMYGKKNFALFPDLGTAKTYMLIRNFVEMWQAGMVDGMLVIAPADVCDQWIDEEWKKSTSMPVSASTWPDPPPGPSKLPRLYVIYPEAFRRKTKNGTAAWNLCRKFLKSGRIGTTVDESQSIKNARSSTSRRIRFFKPLSAFRRIASGFPAPGGRIDYYPQYSFLNTKILGCTTKGQFVDKYCELGGFKGKQIVGYKNEEEFDKRVAPFTYSVELDKCMDMPERTWIELPVKLSKQQSQLIEQAKAEFRIVLDNKTIDTALALQRLTRIQQIACGFLPKLNDKRQVVGLRWLEENRTAALERTLERIRGKVIIWCHFRPCIERLACHFYEGSLIYQGGMSKAEKKWTREAFTNDPTKRWLFAQPKSAGTGLNGLTVARYSLYWSNGYDAQRRKQTERRIWRIGQSRACIYGDFIAEGTYDKKIKDTILRQQNVAAGILADISGWARA